MHRGFLRSPTPIVSADCSSPEASLIAALAAEPGISSVTFFDATTGTPTLAQLQQYQIVVPYHTSICFADGVAMGNVLADYIDGGVGADYLDGGTGNDYIIGGAWSLIGLAFGIRVYRTFPI